jgi:hypothetical protein
VKGAASHAAHELEEDAKDNKIGLYTGEGGTVVVWHIKMLFWTQSPGALLAVYRPCWL